MPCSPPTTQQFSFGSRQPLKPDTWSLTIDSVSQAWFDYAHCRISVDGNTIYSQNVGDSFPDDRTSYMAVRRAGHTKENARVLWAILKATSFFALGLIQYSPGLPYDYEPGWRVGPAALKEGATSTICAHNLDCALGHVRGVIANEGFEYYNAYRTGAYTNLLDEADALEEGYASGAWFLGTPAGAVAGASYEAGWSRMVDALGKRLPSASEYVRQIGEGIRQLK